MLRFPKNSFLLLVSIEGIFNLDKLERGGVIHFADCIVMSRQKWKDEQINLRKESLNKHREAQRRLFEDIENATRRRRGRSTHIQKFNEKKCYFQLLNWRNFNHKRVAI